LASKVISRSISGLILEAMDYLSIRVNLTAKSPNFKRIVVIAPSTIHIAVIGLE